MTIQWDRKCRLTIQIDGSGPEALDMSDFKIVFNVGQPDTSKPKFAEIYIYNVSLQTMNLLCGVDDSNIKNLVVLEVGYGSEELTTLFKGTVFQYRRGRDNQTDTWLCILAQSSDESINYQTINETIPAGTTINGMKDRFMRNYEDTGVQVNETPELSSQELIRGRVCFGSLYDNVLQFSKENECVFEVADGGVSMIESGKYSVVHDVQELTARTGMIGMPQLTSDGLKVNCLLNPKMKYMGRIRVDMTNLQTEAYDIEYGQQGVDQVFKDPRIAIGAEGVFVIMSVIHRGDNRGNDWFSELVCISINGTPPKSGVGITSVG